MWDASAAHNLTIVIKDHIHLTDNLIVLPRRSNAYRRAGSTFDNSWIRPGCSQSQGSKITDQTVRIPTYNHIHALDGLREPDFILIAVMRQQDDVINAISRQLIHHFLGGFSLIQKDSGFIGAG